MAQYTCIQLSIHISLQQTSLDINRRFVCDGNPFTLDIAPQPLGSVCLFGGNYRNDIGQSVIVSSSSCSLPPAPLKGELLSLSCSRNETSFTWHGNHSVNVSGTCYTPQLDQDLVSPPLTHAHTHYVHSPPPHMHTHTMSTHPPTHAHTHCVHSPPPTHAPRTLYS